MQFTESLIKYPLIPLALAGITFVVLFSSFVAWQSRDVGIAWRVVTGDEKRNYESRILGSYAGVGVALGYDEGVLKITNVLPASPASLSGINKGDAITAVNDIPAEKLNLESAVKELRGSEGSVVTLSYMPAGEDTARTARMERSRVPFPESFTVTLEKRDVDLHPYTMIDVSHFSRRTAEYVSNILSAAQSTDRLVIDLRGNSGGVVTSAVHVAGLFVPKHSLIFTERSLASDSYREYRTNVDPIVPRSAKIVVFVDRHTASAAEILASALRTHAGAVLIGENTFGKGSVERYHELNSRVALIGAVAIWQTADGQDLSSDGLNVDIELATNGGSPTDQSYLHAAELYFSK